MSLFEAIRRANQPGPPEDSIGLRVACTLAVLVAIAACASQSEVSHQMAFEAGVLIVAGMTLSYLTRRKPPAFIKIGAAVAAISVLVWFVERMTGRAVTDITTVEIPLTVMFVAIQVIHSFHVPSRRDLLFSLAGAGGLMAVAAAQAIDMHFAFYAVAWLSFTLWGLVELWRSASGGGYVSGRAVGTSVVGVTLAAALIFLLLPAPTVAVRIDFRSKAGDSGPIPVPGALAGDAGSASQLSRPGSPSGRSRVGGYLGFANSLDTALRGNLGRTLIMRVRAQRPSYWIGETFDRWDGQSWVATAAASHVLRDGAPFFLPAPAAEVPAGSADLQTFYIAAAGPNLVFHADSARELWFPAQSVYYRDDGAIVSPIGLGRGAIYTVESQIDIPTARELRQDTRSPTLPGIAEGRYTQLPRPYPEVAALASSVIGGAGATTTYDKVAALIGWMGANTHYSTDIPPLRAGADTVDDFLFGSRVGFCEQISTSLAVMLRTLGIPSREAVGYVPGGYNPLTDLYDVRAADAHAWVQVWFAGHGWQSFDPTAVVPLANPSPGSTALKDVGHALREVPWAAVGGVLGGAALLYAATRLRRSRPATWAHEVARLMDHAGRRVGRPRRPSETMLEYSRELDLLSPAIDDGWEELAGRVVSCVYGGVEASGVEQREMVVAARQLRNETPRHLGSERGQGLAGILTVLLVMGGLGAGVLLWLSPGGVSKAKVPSGLAPSVAACRANYAVAEQAVVQFQTLNGNLPTTIGEVQSVLRDPLSTTQFTISVAGGRPGQLQVATPGHPAADGPGNCAFAGG